MDFIQLADFAKQGMLPVPGGTLSQTQSFLTACRFLWSEENQAESQKWES